MYLIKSKKRMKKGKLIVIEGNDGSGKGTQLKLLLNYLRKEKIQSRSFDFPQYTKTFFGAFVGNFLNGKFGHVSRINPYLAMFPYAADRWQAKEEINHSLEKGKLVICNRYAPSIAYQMAKVKPKEREEFLRWAESLEYGEFAIPKEDMVIFLYVPFHISHQLIDKKGQRSYLNGRKKDQNEENIFYLKRVEKMYLWLNRHKKNWIKIDCVKSGKMLSPDLIHKKIVSIIREKVL